MHLTPESVAREADWVHERYRVVVPLVNAVRGRLGPKFGTTVDPITRAQYHDAVDDVFADGDRAVNVAALVAILRDLDVDGDYPGFVVDELLGRELAGLVAGEHPRRLLAEATFHYADVLLSEREHGPGGGVDASAASAGADDLDAALAAGVQTRLPGWEWTETPSPFDVE